MPARAALLEPAAALPGEAAILAHVLSDLSDETAKLVYADWLEDRDDPRGPFLRGFVAAARAGGELPVGEFPRPWLDLVGVTLTRLARTHGLADRVDALLKVARPTIRVTPAIEPDGGPVLARCRYGGPPDLPPEVEWPLWTNGKPLSFLGQIDLADLAGSVVAHDLPPAGLLSAFYYLNENDDDIYNGGPNFGAGNEGWRLFFFPPATPLAPRPIPDALTWSRFRPHPLTLTETLELLDDRNGWYEQLQFDDETFPRYMDLLEVLNDWDGVGDRLLGHIQFKADHGGTSFDRTWRGLWSIGLTGQRSGLWGDHLIRLHICIESGDLRASRFDRVGLEAQWLST